MTLKSSRIENGYTQEELARILDICLRTYQNYEKNNNCSVKLALSISAILGKPIEEIFKEEK